MVFLPSGLSVEGASGDTVLDVALDHDIPLPHECGGNCACVTCHIRVEAGGEFLSQPEEVEIDRLAGAEGLSPASRLGCQALVLGGGDIAITILESP